MPIGAKPAAYILGVKVIVSDVVHILRPQPDAGQALQYGGGFLQHHRFHHTHQGACFGIQVREKWRGTLVFPIGRADQQCFDTLTAGKLNDKQTVAKMYKGCGQTECIQIGKFAGVWHAHQLEGFVEQHLGFGQHVATKIFGGLAHIVHALHGPQSIAGAVEVTDACEHDACP